MTTEQREQLREVLLDYLIVLMADTHDVINTNKIAQVRLLLREVA
jgi:hypothetical protein